MLRHDGRLTKICTMHPELVPPAAEPMELCPPAAHTGTFGKVDADAGAYLPARVAEGLSAGAVAVGGSVESSVKEHRGSRWFWKTAMYEVVIHLASKDMSTLLSLNHDVFSVILSCITANDALHLAFTCTAAYPLAMARALENTVLGKDKELTTRRISRFRRYMVERDPRMSMPPRAEYLQTLAVRRIGNRERAIDHVAEVLHLTRRLQTLTLSHSNVTLPRPHLVQALRSMERLTAVSLDGFTFATLPALLALPETVECLSLNFSDHFTDRDALPTFRSRALVDALVPFTRLKTLRVSNASRYTVGRLDTQEVYYSAVPFTDWPESTLPSVRRLELRRAEGYVLETLVAACPRVTDISFVMFNWIYSSDLSTIGPQWPPLRSFHFNGLFHWDPSTIQRVSRIRRLFLSNILWEFYTATLQTTRPVARCFPELLRQARPVALTLDMPLLYHTVCAVQEAESIWQFIARDAPMLRSLELKMRRWYGEDEQPDDDHEGFLFLLPETLAALPIVHLGIRVCGSEPKDRPRDPALLLEYCESVRKARASEARRERTLEEVVRRLPDALPHLRLIMVAHEHPAKVPSLDEGGDTANEEQIDSTTGGRMRKMKETEKWRARWWWVRREGDANSMVEIWDVHGEQAKGLVWGEEYEPETTLNDFFAPFRRQYAIQE
ncbi:uncharacterized protein BXZ73DRAFT_105631 [Epithele typhae]|uniref:uncharacterized protein n=1 Tax=Epithele typhae TaxID=378194 RepID=UPI002007F0A8|nr:uncharacterized protein BXZ73DRAFT_105631 [Epithele typhae]KAH9917159.1 hypothetical protein BXZ73DRAFT_105631 [Epithele typhae]